MSIQVSDSSYKANKYTVNFPLTEGFSCSGVLITVASYTPFGNKKSTKCTRFSAYPFKLLHCEHCFREVQKKAPFNSTSKYLPDANEVDRNRLIRNILYWTIGQFFWFINQPCSKLLDTQPGFLFTASRVFKAATHSNTISSGSSGIEAAEPL